MLLAAVAVLIILYVAVKAFKPPTMFFASDESAEQLITKLSCPKCRSRRLRPTSRYTIECENCGFTFSVGMVVKKPLTSS